jgi:hypothetical protein
VSPVGVRFCLKVVLSLDGYVRLKTTRMIKPIQGWHWGTAMLAVLRSLQVELGSRSDTGLLRSDRGNQVSASRDVAHGLFNHMCLRGVTEQSSGTGGIIALGLGVRNWPIQKCILYFNSLVARMSVILLRTRKVIILIQR